MPVAVSPIILWLFVYNSSCSNFYTGTNQYNFDAHLIFFLPAFSLSRESLKKINYAVVLVAGFSNSRPTALVHLL